MDAVQSTTPQQRASRRRKRLSGEKKYQVLLEVRDNPEKKGEILRREGLFQNDLRRYDEIARDASVKALGQMRPGPKGVREVPSEVHEKLKREFEVQEKALAALSVEFMVLKKKVSWD